MKRIAIQGTLGSYHDIAAHKYFEGEEIELICCATFEDVFAAVKKDSKTIGMLAIENAWQGNPAQSKSKSGIRSGSIVLASLQYHSPSVSNSNR